MPNEKPHDPVVETRALLRRAITGTLATVHHQTGVAYASLVAIAATARGEPLMLLSDLALHTRNLNANPQGSLLLASAHNDPDLLDKPRVTLIGEIIASTDDHDRARYLSRYPSAGEYADFTDFRVYRLAIGTAHYIGGFGRIHDLDAARIVTPGGECAEIAAAERDIIAHMNTDHGDAVAGFSTVLLGAPAGQWRMCGCDVTGCDLQSGSRVLRLEFPEPVETVAGLRAMLAGLARKAGKRRAKE